MVSEDVLARYLALFEGRLDQYAVGYVDPNKPWKYRYRKVAAPLTSDLVQQHLNGDEVIGVYCERDGLAHWFAMDFDAPKDDNGHPLPDGFEVALGEATVFSSDLKHKGLLTYIERSRSGNGVHVWGFIDGWVDARQLALLLDATRRPEFVTVDRGKTYPPKIFSENAILICMPYAGEAVESGNSMFLSADRTEHSLEDFLNIVQANPVAVVARAGATTQMQAQTIPGDAPPTRQELIQIGRIDDIKFEGRPEVLGTGIVKMLSPFGCNFMRQVWLQQHDNRAVGENEWYAFLGQLSAFKHGRDAAHAIFRGHKHYNERGCDEKFTHAQQNPPVGCAFIHERFPQFKCAGCPMTAPYRKGYQTIQELCGESPQELDRALYKKDLERIRRLDASDEPEGIPSGIPGVDDKFRLVPSDFVAIGALPSIGKTALAVHMINTIAPTGADVALFSAESGPISFHDRQLAHAAGVDSYALKGLRMADGRKLRLTYEEFAALEQASDWLEGLPIWENYTTTSPERVYDAVEAMLMKRRRPLTDKALVLFDYFQYASGNDTGQPGDEHVRLARASHAYKSLTKIIEQPLVLFAQLKRETEGSDEGPLMTDFRGTARLEHDIDGGLIMTGERMPGRYAPRVLHCVKRREGTVGWKQELRLEQATCRFEGPPAGATVDTSFQGDAPWENAGGQLSVVGPSNP